MLSALHPFTRWMHVQGVSPSARAWRLWPEWPPELQVLAEPLANAASRRGWLDLPEVLVELHAPGATMMGGLADPRGGYLGVDGLLEYYHPRVGMRFLRPQDGEVQRWYTDQTQRRSPVASYELGERRRRLVVETVDVDPEWLAITPELVSFPQFKAALHTWTHQQLLGGLAVAQEDVQTIRGDVVDAAHIWDAFRGVSTPLRAPARPGEPGTSTRHQVMARIWRNLRDLEPEETPEGWLRQLTTSWWRARVVDRLAFVWPSGAGQVSGTRKRTGNTPTRLRDDVQHPREVRLTGARLHPLVYLDPHHWQEPLDVAAVDQILEGPGGEHPLEGAARITAVMIAFGLLEHVIADARVQKFLVYRPDPRARRLLGAWHTLMSVLEAQRRDSRVRIPESVLGALEIADAAGTMSRTEADSFEGRIILDIARVFWRVINILRKETDEEPATSIEAVSISLLVYGRIFGVKPPLGWWAAAVRSHLAFQQPDDSRDVSGRTAGANPRLIQSYRAIRKHVDNPTREVVPPDLLIERLHPHAAEQPRPRRWARATNPLKVYKALRAEINALPLIGKALLARIAVGDVMSLVREWIDELPPPQATRQAAFVPLMERLLALQPASALGDSRLADEARTAIRGIRLLLPPHYERMPDTRPQTISEALLALEIYTWVRHHLQMVPFRSNVGHDAYDTVIAAAAALLGGRMAVLGGRMDPGLAVDQTSRLYQRWLEVVRARLAFADVEHSEVSGRTTGAPRLEPPCVLYHYSLPQNRQSISQHGLQGKYDQTVDLSEPGVVGGIFLSNKLDLSTGSDVWEVDVRGLRVDDDWSGQPEDPAEHWYVVYQDIPPNRVKLLRGRRPNDTPGVATAAVSERTTGVDPRLFALESYK